MFAPLGIDKKADLEVIRSYRRVFLEYSEGRKVLKHMLTELGAYDQMIDNQDDIVRRNYAFRLLRLLGIWDGVNGSEIIEALRQIPVKLKEESEEGDIKA